MKQEEKDGMVWMECSRCGQMFPAYEVEFAGTMASFYANETFRHCSKCREIIAAESERREEEQRRLKYLASVPKLAAASGIPELYRVHRVTGKPISAPIVPHVVKWLWEHRWHNLLIAGKTGVGKSTSACYAAVKMIEVGKKVRYVKLRKLLSEWREARTSDEAFADEKFFDRIGGLDLLILDEMVDKAKTSDSGQEMMYELLDMIADGELKTRLWMIGNFRQGSLDEVFGDRDPVYRRIEENFICVGVTEKEMEEFHIFREER